VTGGGASARQEAALNLTAEVIARATGATLVSATGASRVGAAEDTVFSSFAIDSRRVSPGSLFFAIRGPNRDGHEFVGDAAAAGARGLVVSSREAVPEAASGGIVFLVSDTTRALQDLAARARARLSLVVGITGSAGKTTAKEMTAAVLGRRRPTGRTSGNLNNLFGLPLSILNLPEEATAAVLEMGMSYKGEIARLTEIADPDVGVILNVGEAHLANFESIDAVAEAKGELFRGMRTDATAVWNASDARVRRLAEAFAGRRVSFAVDAAADLVARSIEDDIVGGVRFRLLARGRDDTVRLAIFGTHNVQNAMAALAVASALGNDIEGAVRALGEVRAAPMRGEVVRLGHGIALVDDTYNSNPLAMASVLSSLAVTPWAGRKVLVAGDMLELGPRAASLHRQVGEHAARAGVGLLVAVGPMAAETAAGAGALASKTYEDSERAAADAAKLLLPGDLVLVKGSRGIAMEKFVRAARAAFGEGVA